MSWMSALWRGLAVVVYFAVATVWLPDFVLGLSPVQKSSQLVRDLLSIVIWGGALVAGMLLLRRAQSRRLI